MRAIPSRRSAPIRVSALIRPPASRAPPARARSSSRCCVAGWRRKSQPTFRSSLPGYGASRPRPDTIGRAARSSTMDTKTRQFDRTNEDVGNIVLLEHVNVTQPDQRPTTLFYVVALGGTRDPYVFVGLENMWVNYGRTQMHMPSRDPQPQVIRGTIGFVVPEVEAVKARMKRVSQPLAGTKFSWKDKGETVEATCPWGNRVRCHAPAPHFGENTQLGMVYIDFDVSPGSAEGIARFYSEIMGAPSKVVAGSPGGKDKRAARVAVGRGQALYFSETDSPIPAYDGHHMEIYINDFSGPY